MDDFVEPIKYLLKELNNPLKVTAMVCWTTDTRLRFSKKMVNSSEFYRNIQFGVTEPLVEYFPSVTDESHHLMIVDLNCHQTQKFLIDVGMKITHRFKWIILTNKTQENENVDERFKDLPIYTNSEVYLIFQEENFEFLINQVYRISHGKSLITEPFGNYKNRKFVVIQNNKDAAIRRRNLQGQTLRATLVITNNDTFHHMDDYRNRQIDTNSKVCYFLTNHLIAYVNGTPHYKYVNSWGYKDQNTNRWSGMIGDLTENRSDIGASALFFTGDRIVYIDYIAMATPTRSKFVFRSPKLSYTDNVFLLPFDTFVWYSLFALIIITAMALMVVTWFEFKLQLDDSHLNQDLKFDSSILKPSLLDTFLLVFGATCQQGSSVAPKSFTARAIMMLIFTMLMFLYTSYSAFIVALLQSPSNKVKNLEDLLHSRLKMGADDTVFNHYYFTRATEPTRKAIYERKIRNRDGSENFFTLADGVEKMREGLFAFHMEIGVGYKVVEETFLEDEKCGLQEVQYLQVIDPWMSIQKNSSYKELFKTGMMRIHEHGLQERENFALYTRKPRCVGGGGKFVTASLVDTKPAILVLLWGFLIAFFIFITEKIINRWILKLNIGNME